MPSRSGHGRSLLSKQKSHRPIGTMTRGATQNSRISPAFFDIPWNVYLDNGRSRNGIFSVYLQSPFGFVVLAGLSPSPVRWEDFRIVLFFFVDFHHHTALLYSLQEDRIKFFINFIRVWVRLHFEFYRRTGHPIGQDETASDEMLHLPSQRKTPLRRLTKPFDFSVLRR